MDLTNSNHEFLLEGRRDPAQEEEHAETFRLALRDAAEAQNLAPPQPQTQWAEVAATLRALNLRLALR